jgi:hypothetical protein
MKSPPVKITYHDSHTPVSVAPKIPIILMIE